MGAMGGICPNCRMIQTAGKSKMELLRGTRHHKAILIRHHARKVYFSALPEECLVCGYSLHVEVAHVKAISEFPDDVLLAEINSLDNFLGLCPTHHWEFDHGHLDIDELQERKNALRE